MASSADPAKVARELEDARDELAEATTERLYQANPGWEERWGPRGRELTEEDLGYTLTFLASAIREGSPEVFTGYVSWLRSVLEPRGVETSVIEETHVALAEQLDDHLREDASELARSYLESAEDALEGPLEVEPPPEDERVLSMTAALLDGDAARAGGIVEAELDAGKAPSEIADELITSAMQEVGRRWQLDEISVADEHLATATTRKVLADLYRRRRFEEPGRGRVLLACVEGCRHSLGLEMVGDSFEEEGWEVRQLGADVPVEHLVEHASSWSPDVVCLSISMPQQLPAARQTIEGLQEATSQAVWILIGGRIANQLPGLHHVLGADGWASTAQGALDEVA